MHSCSLAHTHVTSIRAPFSHAGKSQFSSYEGGHWSEQRRGRARFAPISRSYRNTMSEKVSYSEAASRGRLGKLSTRPTEQVSSGAQPYSTLDYLSATTRPKTTMLQGDAAASPTRGIGHNFFNQTRNGIPLDSEAPTPTQDSPGRRHATSKETAARHRGCNNPNGDNSDPTSTEEYGRGDRNDKQRTSAAARSWFVSTRGDKRQRFRPASMSWSLRRLLSQRRRRSIFMMTDVGKSSTALTPNRENAQSLNA